MKEPPQNTRAVARRPDGKLLKGATLNPGGRPKKLREIEAMLDAEHRTVERMREVYERLRDLALGQPMDIRNSKGELIRVELRAHPGFMEIYLNRVQGPVEKLKLDLADAPDVVINWLADKLN